MVDPKATVVEYYVSNNQQTYQVMLPSGAKSVHATFEQKNKETGVRHPLTFRAWPAPMAAKSLEDILTPLVPSSYTPCTETSLLDTMMKHLGSKPVFVFKAKDDALAKQVLKRKLHEYTAKGVKSKIQKCYHGSKVEHVQALGTWGGLKDLSGRANGRVHGRGFNVTTVDDPSVETAAFSLEPCYAPPTKLGTHTVRMVVQYDGLVGHRTYVSNSAENEPKKGYVTLGNGGQTMSRNGKITDIRVFQPGIMNTHLVPTAIAFFK